MIKKIYIELMLVRKELQAIRSCMESILEDLREKQDSGLEHTDVVLVRRPYSHEYEILPRSNVKIPN